MTTNRGSARLVEVAVPLPVFTTFTYFLPPEIQYSDCLGCRVLVPFRSRHLVGLVVESRTGTREKLKPILRVLDAKPVLPPALLKLALWLSRYYFAPPGETARVMLPPGLLARTASPDSQPEKFWPAKRQLAVTRIIEKRNDSLTGRQQEVLDILRNQPLPQLVASLVRETNCSDSVLRTLSARGRLRLEEIDVYRSPWAQPRVPPSEKHLLNEGQKMALQAIRRRLEEQRFAALLLHGVTGSGKTELYLNAISEVIDRGRSALMLVPEIGLTPQVARQFRAWFQDKVAIQHSALSGGERFDQWRRIRKGEARVVVGTRSAVFAPLQELGLIVIDEEHDTSYKQEEMPRYHARDTALMRGKLEAVPVILGSATPQLESFYRAVDKQDTDYIELRSRILHRPLPTVEIVDMRLEFEKHGSGVILSELLRSSILKRLEKKEQVLVLLNRRGYAAALLCRSCGHVESCINCSISLTFHNAAKQLNCHYCGYSKSVPQKCADCGKEYIYFVGEGTEKIEEILRQYFPEAAIDRMDRDSVRRKGSLEKILDRFRQARTDILLGTQMIAKGHDFPGVTLVGVLGSDQALRLPDFRAAERTFQLLTQVAGRAGRGDNPGQVIIQTYYPNHYSLKYACTQQYRDFYDTEIRFRRRFRYPPFVALANILIKGADETTTWRTADHLRTVVTEQRNEIATPAEMRILGPATAAVERIKKDYRVQVLVKTTTRQKLHRVLKKSLEILEEKKIDLRSISVDVDPMNLL